MEQLNDLGVDKRHIILALLVIGVAAAFASVAYQDVNETAEEPEVNQTEQPRDPNDIRVSPSQVEGEIVQVTLSGMSADPSRPTIAQEDAIEFINNEDISLELSFDRDYNSVNVESGDSVILDIDQITYYTASPVDDGVEYRNIERGVNVQ